MKTRHIALLRAVNVGGNNILPMVELRALFESLGCSNVRTYIQSGNVVFDASTRTAATIASRAAAAIEKQFGLKTPVVMRSAAELSVAASSNPFIRRGVDTKQLHLAFLADTPSARAASQLDVRRSPGDSFELQGRDLYICFAAGAGKTKLTNAYFDSTLGTVSTMRNWRTVETLVGMCGS